MILSDQNLKRGTKFKRFKLAKWLSLDGFVWCSFFFASSLCVVLCRLSWVVCFVFLFLGAGVSFRWFGISECCCLKDLRVCLVVVLMTKPQWGIVEFCGPAGRLLCFGCPLYWVCFFVGWNFVWVWRVFAFVELGVFHLFKFQNFDYSSFDLVVTFNGQITKSDIVDWFNPSRDSNLTWLGWPWFELVLANWFCWWFWKDLVGDFNVSRTKFHDWKVYMWIMKWWNLNVKIPRFWSWIKELRLRIGVKLKLHKIF